jgi:4,4'-diaponeurosporenoate glycosyltransferase
VDPILFAAIGWVLGWLLWGRPRELAEAASPAAPARADDHLADALPPTTIVIPARDEAATLPLLLADLAADHDHRRIVVVDDHSSDGTGELARGFAGVTVIDAPDLPDGWTGKSWACHAATSTLDLADDDVIVFLDADVRVVPGAIAEVVRQVVRDGGVVSVQPFHAMERPYEQLSLYPGVISFLGTGAGGRRRPPTGVYGPLIATRAGDYRAVGGHASVRDAITEDVALGIRYRDAELPVAIRLGGDLVRFRMYPAGFHQLAEGWTKNMATGATTVPVHRSLGAFWWITAAGSAAMSLPLVPGNGGVGGLVGAAVYALFVVQLAAMARRVGSFHAATVIAYPVALVTFMALFFRSVWHSRIRRSVRWRGRSIPVVSAHPA